MGGSEQKWYITLVKRLKKWHVGGVGTKRYIAFCMLAMICRLCKFAGIFRKRSLMLLGSFLKRCWQFSSWCTCTCQTSQDGMTLPFVCHDSFICVTWPIISRPCPVELLCAVCVKWLIHMCHAYASHDSCICAPWLMHMWDDSCICAPKLMHIWAMAHAHVHHDSCTCEPWLRHMCAATYARVWHDSCIRVA